jgi:outer membrane lipoprotein SlyB
MQKTPVFTPTALLLALTYGACAPSFAAEPVPGVVQAEASMAYPDGSVLKLRPTEVQIVKAEQMQKSVAGKVALGVFLFALGGGTGYTSSSKDNMVGSTIEGLEDRNNLQIGDAGAFANHLQAAVQVAMQNNTEWADKTFKKPITVAGGVVNLVYEGLTGDDATRYRLKADWVVYKQRESFSLFGAPNTQVDCSYASPTPMTQAAWAEDHYALVKAAMDAMLPSCEEKV